MVIDINPDQRIELELIAIHAGKSPAQLLTETARYLLDQDMQFWETVQNGSSTAPSNCQSFLDEDAMDARFSQLLGRPAVSARRSAHF